MELHYRQSYEMTKSSPPGGDQGRERASFKVTLLENGPIRSYAALENPTRKPAAMQNDCPESSVGSQWVSLRTRLFSFSGGQGEIGEPPGKVLESD